MRVLKSKFNNCFLLCFRKLYKEFIYAFLNKSTISQTFLNFFFLEGEKLIPHLAEKPQSLKSILNLFLSLMLS